MDMPDTPQRGSFDPFTKLPTMIAGADDETLRQCPPQDVSNVKAVSGLLLCTFIYSAAVFSVISHRLFAEPEGGQIAPPTNRRRVSADPRLGAAGPCDPRPHPWAADG
jgi:hypothetical protein